MGDRLAPVTNMSFWQHEQRLLDCINAINDAYINGEDVDESVLAVLNEYVMQATNKRDNMVRALRELEHKEAAIQAEIDLLKKHCERVKRVRQGLEQYVLYVMRTLDVKVLEGDVYTLRRRNNPVSVLVDNVDALPEDCVVHKVTTQPDKAAIKAKLQAGEAVPGASLQVSERLEIK